MILFRHEICHNQTTKMSQKWSYRAKNSTLRAIKKAGFNEQTFPNLTDIIMVTEPEAAAIYTARHLKEDKKTEFLKVSFVSSLCCHSFIWSLLDHVFARPYIPSSILIPNPRTRPVL